MKSGTVAIVGRPNSGKSTLLNALVRQKISIVSDKPQTTRHRILGILTEERGQVAFADTPGIHKPGYRMNQRMLRTVSDVLAEMDVVLLIVDGSISFGAGESFALEMVKNAGVRALLLINKIDRMAKPQLLPIMERYGTEGFLEIIPISARNGENLKLVVDKIFEYLPDGEARFDPEMITDRTERFMTAEFIREKILIRTREEIPYATAVLVRNFDESQRETSKKLVVIEADILVEKKSQQGIVLGSAGAQIREIGTLARRDIEELLGCKVFLSLRVETVRKWRDNDSVLDDLGVGS